MSNQTPDTALLPPKKGNAALEPEFCGDETVFQMGDCQLSEKLRMQKSSAQIVLERFKVMDVLGVKRMDFSEGE